jgi:hypothetical protein
MRYLVVALSLAIGSVSSAHAQVSVGFGVDIGIHVPVYPELVVVPGTPVYYDPRGDANYFFYDGLYWVFQGDGWYASSWYDGPWRVVPAERVPLYVLRVPVRYYHRPPPYFRGWYADAPPRWGQRWGPGWERNHRGWDRWDRRGMPRPAPLPVYQRQYAGDRYPRAFEQQHALGAEHYRYRPRETVAREQFRGPPGGPRSEPSAYRGGPRGEPQWQHDRGGPMQGPRDDGRGRAYPDRGGYPGGPRAEPPRGPDRGGMRGPDPRAGGPGPRYEQHGGAPGGPRAEPPRPQNGGGPQGPGRDDRRHGGDEGHGRP